MGKMEFRRRMVLTNVWFLFSSGVCLAAVGISVTPNTFNAGTGGSGNFTSWTPTLPAGGGVFTLTNIGDTPGVLKIRATNTTPNNWTLGAVPGVNTFALQWGQTIVQGEEPARQPITLVARSMFGLAAQTSSRLDVWFQSPSDLSDRTLTATQQSVVTIGIEPSFFEATTYGFFKKWGGFSNLDGQFFSIGGVAIDASGNVYAVDIGNDRIQKFTSDGTFITKLGSRGTSDGQFNVPVGVAIDASGNVYVTEINGNRVQKFTSDGAFIAKWGSTGSGDGQFNSPLGIAVDALGDVYVADVGNQRIQKFTSNGTFIRAWGSGRASGDGQFNAPLGIAVGASGSVYVADLNNHRIQQFTPNGTFVAKWGSLGSGDGQFTNPQFVAVDASGNVYVTDGENDRVQKFTSNGTFITKFGSAEPSGIAVDISGNIYVGGSGLNSFVQVFAP